MLFSDSYYRTLRQQDFLTVMVVQTIYKQLKNNRCGLKDQYWCFPRPIRC